MVAFPESVTSVPASTFGGKAIAAGIVVVVGDTTPIVASIGGCNAVAVSIVVPEGCVTALVASERLGCAFELEFGGGVCNAGGVTGTDVATVSADVGDLVRNAVEASVRAVEETDVRPVGATVGASVGASVGAAIGGDAGGVTEA